VSLNLILIPKSFVDTWAWGTNMATCGAQQSYSTLMIAINIS